MQRRLAFLWAIIAVFAQQLQADESPDDLFEKHIRPLLVERCLECHGPDEPEGGLRLTSRDELLKGGDRGAAMVPEAPEESLLIQAVRYETALQMPPDGPLTADEVDLLARWIEAGAPWPQNAALLSDNTAEPVVSDADRQHWAFQPIANPAVPPVVDRQWPQSSIDYFILHRLEGAGLAPSPAADRRTLLRRVYYDLIGLPPTWEEIEAFAADDRPQALAEVVDRLLASPQYGERWGRHWLDVARFADTKDGVLMYGDDRIRPYAYTYRHYIVRAMNEDLPFDRFVHEQLAADLIEPPVEPWRLAAMGFLTLGRMYDNNLHDIIDDQIDTVTRGFLGLTVSCARCHDHKYDPIPTADYYSLYGVMANSEPPLELPLIVDPATMPGAVEFEQQAAVKREEIKKFLDEQFEMLTETTRQRVGDYLVHAVSTRPDPLETAIFFLSLAPDDLRPPIVAGWRRFLQQRSNLDDPVFGPWHDLMEALPPVEGTLTGSVAAASAEQNLQENSHDIAARVAAVLEHWQTRSQGTEPGQVNPVVLEALSRSTLQSRIDVARCYGDLLHSLYEQSKTLPHNIGTASPTIPDPARQQLLDLVVGTSSPLYFPKSQTRRYMSRQPKDKFGGMLGEVDRMAVTSQAAPPRAMVLYDSATPQEPRIFVRGNPSQPGQTVPRQFLEILSTEPRAPFGPGSGRLDLAHAITAPDNPLTSRVIINRIWMYYFGEPLVSSPSDFGKRSTPPTHPELLDHLARRLMDEGWSLKKVHRWIILSSAYQQSSLPTPEAAKRGAAVDPDNRLLWKMNRQRLDFEAMRDTLLSVSGRLEYIHRLRPVDIDADPLSRCRTVWGLVDRQSLPSMFRAFDFATPDQSVERRPRTMVPQQALFALNAPFVLEQARAVAERTASSEPSDAAQRITSMYRIVLGREPTVGELASATQFVNQPAQEGSQLTAWQQLAQVLLSTNELMYID